jgi:hypothetical protein
VACLLFVAPSVSHATNPLFGYTHMLPSPRTLPAGRLAYGTTFAYGITDFFQVSSGVLRDFYKFFNAEAKVSLVDLPGFALSPYVGWESYNYHNISDSNPDLAVMSYLPGMVAAIELDPTLAWFIGGNLNFTKTQLVTSGIETSGYIQGATGGSDLSWAYNYEGGEETPQPRRGRASSRARRSAVGNVLSAGVTWDFTYKIFGVGISHHWPGFHLGVHYYPSVTHYPVQPIVAGGGSFDF